MNERKTSVFENGMIWFGAAVSMAEIITGTYFAPLGFVKGIWAIIIGHIIGCTLLFFAGVIGGKTRRNAMETVKMSFGERGSILFSVLNILQLVGWTGIMIFDGAVAANGIWQTGEWVWCIVISALIILWILIGVKNLGKVNVIAMTGLFILTIILSFVIFGKTDVSSPLGEAMTFGAAVELSVAMPLSWLPLISDYTKDAEKPVRATLASSAVYGIVSCWMYIIGMGATIFAGESDIAQIMLKTGLGIAGLLIVILSTVTTTFLDAYSAGISATALSHRINGKYVAVAATVLGCIGAIFLPLYNISNFLSFIGSVFAPMIAILIADFFVLKKDSADSRVNIKNLCIWLTGFVLYRLLMKTDFILGSTLPDMVITLIICVIADKVFSKKQHQASKNILR